MAESEQKKLTQDSSDKANAPKQTKTPKTTTKSGSHSLTILLILMVAIACGSGGYYLWQKQLHLINTQRADTNRLQLQLKQILMRSDKLDQSIKTNAGLIQLLEKQQTLNTELSQRALDVTNRAQRDWVIAEIDYLLRIANRRLQIARDINSSIAALQGADQRIHDLGDLKMLPIRKQLAKDIGNLKALHQIDVNGAALALDQMISHLGNLPYKSIQEEVKTQLEIANKATGDKQEEGFVDSVIDTVMKIGDIKVHERSIQPASTAQQQQQIEQILRNHLLGARLAVLRFDQQQFSHDINASQKLIHLHYKSTDNRVKQIQKDLTEFANVNLVPALPDISKSWNMLQDILQEKPLTPKKNAPADGKESKSTSQKTVEVL